MPRVRSGQHIPVRTVIAGGQRAVEAGRQVQARDIGEEFALTMRRLLA